MIPGSIIMGLQSAWDLTGWRFIAGAALMAAPAFVLGQCSGADAERAKIEAERLAENIRIDNIDDGARERAAEQRLQDALDNDKLKRELSDAIKGIPDGEPGAIRRQLGCERLRKAGAREADLPAECGPAR